MTIIVQQPGATSSGAQPTFPNVTVVGLPKSIDNCFQTFSETHVQTQGRTAMENGDIKTRRRVTAAWRNAEASILLKREQYDDWKQFVDVNTRDGELPAFWKMPYGRVEAWRISEAPTIDWSVDAGAKVFRVSLKLEQNPAWKGLVAP